MGIQVIDLFAGPGGLGEGFSSVKDYKGGRYFDIALSIEKDENAHKTLTWRSFYRQFRNENNLTKDYYNALEISSLKEREIFIEDVLTNYPEGRLARNEVLLHELGSDIHSSDKVDELINDRLDKNKPWVLIGGPPCQAYSNVGRSRVGGISEEDHRVYLYREYLRIIKQHNPTVFVMENVRGLLSAKLNDKSIFSMILDDLSCNNEYQIHSFVKQVEDKKDYLIKAEEYGIPQKRHRIILLGLKNGIKHTGRFLKKSSSFVSVSDVIKTLPRIRSGLNREFVDYDKISLNKNGQPRRIYSAIEDSYENWLKVILLFKQRISSYNLQYDYEIHEENDLNIGKEYIPYNVPKINNVELDEWIRDSNLNGVINHESRKHLKQDLLRYLFAGVFLKVFNRFPKLYDYQKFSSELLPDHSNVLSGKFVDRFRVQHPEQPGTTITSHISKDGHYFIHYDISQIRSLTVREAARIQTFPDNYLFRGSRTSQFVQVGNAVPPLLAKKIAEIVKEILIENEEIN